MFTTPSMTITPVYNTTQHKLKCPASLKVSTVTVQVEPVDLSTRPTHHAAQEKDLWGFTTGPYLAQTHDGVTQLQDTVTADKDREKMEKISDWRKNKKIHQCAHPGCEKVKQTNR